jgi:hypothetical protein
MPKKIFLIAMAVSMLTWSSLADDVTVFYDISQASQSDIALAPNYGNGAEELLNASQLQHNDLSYPTFCCLEGPGHWVFTGWSIPPLTGSDGPNIEFSITAKADLLPKSLKYSFFRGNWSDIYGGPGSLYVWASTNDFATGILVAQHLSLAGSKPWNNTVNNFDDDVSEIGKISSGQTLKIRFLASYDGPWSRPNYAPGGFMHHYSDNHDVTLVLSNIVVAPSIILQPITHVASLGSTVTFSTAASGTNPRYEWYFNNTAIPGGTNSTLIITNVGPSNVGSYHAVARNSAGTATSDTANLILDEIKCYPGIHLFAPIGTHVTVQYTTSLSPPVQWTDLTNITITTMPTIVFDFGAPEAAHRNYRIVPD